METPFDHNRRDYVHSLHRSGGKKFQSSLSLFFVDGRLDRFEGNFKPAEADPEAVNGG